MLGCIDAPQVQGVASSLNGDGIKLLLADSGNFPAAMPQAPPPSERHRHEDISFNST
jgi:hypothetical protein